VFGEIEIGDAKLICSQQGIVHVSDVAWASMDPLLLNSLTV
jgi:hypothetical protein